MRFVSVVCLLLVAAGCQATPPSSPSPTPASLAILVSPATQPVAFSSMTVSAYLADSDGAYKNVSARTRWTSSNAAVLSFTSLAGANDLAVFRTSLGSARLLASYENLSAELPVTVGANPMIVPFISMRSSVSSISVVRPQASIDASYFNTAFGVGTNVAASATWVSSDPSVATMDGGVVTGLKIGTTELTATFGGATGRLYLSVLPSQLRP
jgi:hypothetical protein